MKCPSCEGVFGAPLGQAEGACVFCGVTLRVNAGVQVVRGKDESGVTAREGWEHFGRPLVDGREERPMFVVQQKDRALAVY